MIPKHDSRTLLLTFAFIGVLTFPGLTLAQQQRRPLVPVAVELEESVRETINAEWLTEQERKDLRVFHGVWDRDDLDTPKRQATAALNAWDFDHPALSDPNVAVEIRAEAMLKQGRMQRAIALLDGVKSNHGVRIRAEAHFMLGQLAKANQTVDKAVENLTQRKTEDPAELTEGVQALFVRSRIEGKPARDYKTMLNLLGRAHQKLDRLYWPAKIAEAELLLAKDNKQEAVAALHETLSLNPRSSAAWHMLGEIALGSFDFDSVTRAARALQRLNPQHPLADLLIAESWIIQNDPARSILILQNLRSHYPKMRPALALLAAAHGRTYDNDAMQTALDGYDELSPGSAEAYYKVGEHLSLDRQYELAADVLEEAVAREPNWPPPQIELGLLELQSGHDNRAFAALKEVARLDPFNKRAANSLFLLETITGYSQLESEHFILRYKPGIDEVLAEIMLEPLEDMHAEVAARFEHEPDRKTVIELMPDHQFFSVRITGMPWIHTIAACTGPVIALEVPREGPKRKHLGPFDWLRVLRHEYTHTITLSQTRNRIPHWLTEAAAVSEEQAPRDYETCKALAEAYKTGSLFTLDEINWAFVRPKKPGDRSLAYAQGHWMVEYMDEAFGESALVRLLEEYFDGVNEEEAIPNALGVGREEFFRGFLDWAQKQVRSWGLLAEPSLETLKDQLRDEDPELQAVMLASRQARLEAIVRVMTERIGSPSVGEQEEDFTSDRWPKLRRPPVQIDEETLGNWLEQYPGHPGLLGLKLRRAMKNVDSPDEDLIPLIERYQQARPVDMYPQKILARMYLDSSTPGRAIPPLEALNIRADKTDVYALELAKLYRARGDLAEATRHVNKAVRVNPYAAPTRELAAAIALQAKQLQTAHQHIRALTLLEPDRPQHARRLNAVEKLLDKSFEYSN